MKRTLKGIVASAGTSRLLQPVFAPLVDGLAVIFMLHRFRDDRHGTHGHGPVLIERTLAELRSRGVPILSLTKLVGRLAAGNHVRGVAFTVDDGYYDFGTVAAPIFQRFDCPVTVFLTTGFLDREFWFWWDQLHFALRETRAKAVTLQGGAGREEVVPVRWVGGQCTAARRVQAWVKEAPETERRQRIDRVLDQLDVKLPSAPPEPYAPLDWDTVRNWAAQGVDFAPHSRTHPSMGGLDAKANRSEVRHSYRRLKEELGEVAPVFCYPYGQAPDVSEVAVGAVRAERLRAAVTATPGYVGAGLAADRFRLPRFAMPDNLIDIRQVVFGFERFKQLITRRR